MGHSLGLRHNFSGSTDGENFYTDSEVKDILSDSSAKAPAYASVMDYAFSEYNELASFGKYDVAALKFSYTGKMQTYDGEGVKVKKGTILPSYRSDFNKKIEDEFIKIVREVFQVPADEELDFSKAKVQVESVLVNPPSEDAANFLKNLLTATDKRIVNFKFCTDENAGLSTSCNRFDEGTSLLEITKHKIERYNNSYKYRNFRNERNNFSSHGLGNYLVARYSEFNFIRDLIEDYELYADFFSPELMENGCSQEQVALYPVCKDINDRRESVLLAADFFIDILKTPDHLCALASPDAPTTIVEYRKLQTIYDSIKFGIDKHLVTSCFDEEVKKELAKADDPLVVIGENGKFLNEFKDTNPKYRFSSDRSVRGIWADKVVAMRMLFDRTGSTALDTNHMALVDHPVVKQKVNDLIKHMVLGKALSNPLPFTTESGQKFVVPYVIGNDYKIDQVEDSLYWIKQFVGLPENGSGNLTEAILSQITSFNLSFDDEMEETVYDTTNYVTVRKHRTYDDLDFDNGDLKSIEVGRFSYVAGPENVIAYYIANVEEKKKQFDELDKKVIEDVLKSRTVLVVPSDLSPAQLAFWNVEDGLQVFIINKAKEEAAAVTPGVEPVPALPLEAFNTTFGTDNGPLIYSLYVSAIGDNAAEIEGVRSQKIANIALMSNPPEGASDIIKNLYGEDIEIIQDYLAGRMSTEVFEYYKKQLVKLPRHRDTKSI